MWTAKGRFDRALHRGAKGMADCKGLFSIFSLIPRPLRVTGPTIAYPPSFTVTYFTRTFCSPPVR
jgi:hypothetical protein